ncbi:diadenylate cyclase [Micromonospora sp. NPDC092111]|uniref:diadenylate cyclase n=1 Tax=Micromonospora sp. NPDC092111 TaxID=3364289 RepID=UPI003818FCAF
MWGYQYLFRSSLEHSSDSALKAIGFAGEPKAMLVGFQISGQHAYDVCIEPEDGPYKPSDFAGARRRAVELYDNHEERNMIHSHPGMHETFHRRLKRRLLGEAIVETLQQHHASHGREFFFGGPTVVGDYRVYAVIHVAKEELAKVPRLQSTRRDRFSLAPSLVHALVEEILYRASMNLFVPDAGADLEVLGAGSPELVRSATSKFVRGILYRAGSIFAEDHDLLFSAISALPYEGRSGVGRLIIGDPANNAIKVALKLRNPVPVQDTRAVRKLVEASTETTGILMHDGDIYGLGSVSKGYDETDEALFEVALLGRGSWDVRHGAVALLSVRDGIAHLPANILDFEILADSVTRKLTRPDVSKLAALARAASRNDHGAMLVISDDAATEAARLEPQAWSVEPFALSEDMLSQLTAMDGAILVDPEGNCHAIGVILDGRAAGRGDPARGSRFNNALRYLDSSPPPAVVVVYSTDGGVDVLPKLEPRVAKEAVAAAVERYLTLAVVRHPIFKEVYGAWDKVKAYQFYLSQEQCDALNGARKEFEEWRMKTHGMSIGAGLLAPHPLMEESYWI